MSDDNEWRAIAEQFYGAAQLARLGVMYSINDVCDKYEAMVSEDEAVTAFRQMIDHEMNHIDQQADEQPKKGKPWEGKSPEHMTGADILLEAHHLITGDRNKEYSHPIDDYQKVTSLFLSMTGIDLSVPQAILFMLAIKLARLRSNLEKGILHHDSVVDAAGYLGCLAIVHYDSESYYYDGLRYD